MKYTILKPRQIVLTDAVSGTDLSWLRYEIRLRKGILPPPVIVARVYRGRQRAFILLDGNHRACVCAYLSKPIRAWVVLSDKDAAQILELDRRGDIPEFPHCAFLDGSVSLEEMVDKAMKHAVAESVADVIARVARERNLQALCTPTMKPKVTYEFSRLCFRADVIEPLGDDDRFCVMTPEGKFVMTKRQFYSVFANVVQTRSYLKHGIYHYPKTPRKADPFCHPS